MVSAHLDEDRSRHDRCHVAVLQEPLPRAVTISAYVVRNVNLLAQTMPSPWAPEGDWVAYEQSRFEFKPYEVGRELFLQDQADRVAE